MFFHRRSFRLSIIIFDKKKETSSLLWKGRKYARQYALLSCREDTQGQGQGETEGVFTVAGPAVWNFR